MIPRPVGWLILGRGGGSKEVDHSLVFWMISLRKLVVQDPRLFGETVYIVWVFR